jgi:hypothetical protein
VAGQNWQTEQKEFHRLYAMVMRRGRLGTYCGIVGGGVSRGLDRTGR